MTNSQQFIERAEQARDLKGQLANLGRDEEQEFQFYEWSPGRTMVDIWSTETGEKITLPRYMAESAINTVREDGQGYRFTARPELAPPEKVNSVMCPLHKDSAERGFMEEIGIISVGEIGCPNRHLASESSKWLHFRAHHKEKAKQYQDEIDRREREADRAMAREQRDAMLALAGQATDTPRRGRPPKGELDAATS